MVREFRLPHLDATESFGRRLAAALGSRPVVVGLSGPLGAGKSTLARAALRTLGVTGVIPSPTYTLVEPYEIGERTVYHLDLYRLGTAEEIETLGILDLAPDAVLLVEWPERAGTRLHFDLVLDLAYRGTGRILRAQARTDRGQSVLAALDEVPA